MKKSVILVLLLILILPISESRTTITEVKGDSKTRDRPTSESVRHVYGLGHVADVKDGEISYNIQDRVISTRLNFEANNVANTKKFLSLPFGQQLINDGVRYSFATGHEFDGDLYHMGARYYDPNVGRFTQKDPIAGNNPYAYADNNPIGRIDIGGKESIKVGNVEWNRYIFDKNSEMSAEGYSYFTRRGIVRKVKGAVKLYNEEYDKKDYHICKSNNYAVY